MPKVSAILPLYNGVKFIEESINSIISQTFQDWEFIIVNECGSDDGSVEIIKKYKERDSRIVLIQNDIRLGLSESLNRGIQVAKGEYIARVDVDDPSYPERFQKQVDYLDTNLDVFLCGTLQRSVTPNKASVLEVPCDREELKTALLFGCEISHCSVMFRRIEWLEKGYRYNSDSLCEDYDLWTKIMFEKKLVNMPEVLVDHRWGFDNISITKGDRLLEAANEVSIRVLAQFGVSVDKKDDFLVSGWRNEPKKYAKQNTATFLRKTYLFLTNLQLKNRELGLIEEKAIKKILWRRWDWACKCAGLFFSSTIYDQLSLQDSKNPIVSIIMPVYNAVSTLRESIDSVIMQTFKEWELILICESENWDGSTELAKYYAEYDKRIKVIENQKIEGLSNSLNIGINAARGEYIARLDADDLSNPARLVTQVNYMQKHPDIGITQFYQHYFGNGANDFIHRPSVTEEGLKARLLFFCDVCHSTVMFRSELFKKPDFRYDSEHALEDYDLWCKAVRTTKIVTIPEIYGEYRVDGDRISVQKKESIINDMCNIIAKQLKDNLNIEVEFEDIPLLNGWTNYFSNFESASKQIELERLKKLLLKIWTTNKKMHFYDQQELLKAIALKWRWSKYNISWHEDIVVDCIEEALEIREKEKKKVSLKLFLKGMLKLVQNIHFHTFAKNIEHISNVTKDVANAQKQGIDKSVERWTWERYKRIDKSIERWTWERYVRTEKQLKNIERQNVGIQQSLASILFDKNRVKYLSGEKVRIVFLYQVPSFWPSWETLYKECQDNSDVDAKLVFLDETNSEKSQMIGAEKFLSNLNLKYERFEEFDLDSYSPHIIVLQTPYDVWHRQPEHWSNRFKEKGYRIVYIPYGIEISDTEDSHNLHFRENVIENAWRIYTFSEVMKKDYYRYCANARAVRALGLPRFDYYKQINKAQLRENIVEKDDIRKIVVWKVHFPKNIIENGKKITVTPSLDEYIQFAKTIKDYKDFIFLFVPHPKFFENNDPVVVKKINSIMSILSRYDNVIVSTNDDYRPSIAVADFVIIDRSAVMVEVGALDVPICYVTNKNYYEPIPKSIDSLINSYYQAEDCSGIIKFLDMCRNGEDYFGVLRKRAFEKCIPMFDGLAGKRVLEDIINGVREE